MSGDRIYWKDGDCGYREVTTSKERYDYNLHKMFSQDVKVISFKKPRPPLPAHQQPEYLRKGIIVEVPGGQQKITEALA